MSDVQQPAKVRNNWNRASLFTLLGGVLVVMLLGVVSTSIWLVPQMVGKGEEATYGLLTLIVSPFKLLDAGYHSVFAVAAALLAAVGIRKFGFNSRGVILLCVSLLFSVPMVTLIRHVQTNGLL